MTQERQSAESVLMEKPVHTPAHCSKCDERRRKDGLPQKVGQPCDICDGRGFDYIGRPCRHAHIDGEDGRG